MFNGIVNFFAPSGHSVAGKHLEIISPRPVPHPNPVIREEIERANRLKLERLYLTLLIKEQRGEYLTEAEKLQLRILKAIKYLEPLANPRVILC